MGILNNILIGFIASFIGVIPPGLLNLSAAKIKVQEGSSRAYLFSAGVAFTVILQTLIGLTFAHYLNKRPDIIEVLKWIAVGVFILLSVYFLFFAKDSRVKIPKEDRNSHANRFFAGILLAIVNLFPLPYWIYIGITFSNLNYLDLSTSMLVLSAIASGLGTFATLTLYIKYFNKQRAQRLENLNLNWLIGGIIGLIALVSLVKML